jgi:hypothetical protein
MEAWVLVTEWMAVGMTGAGATEVTGVTGITAFTGGAGGALLPLLPKVMGLTGGGMVAVVVMTGTALVEVVVLEPVVVAEPTEVVVVVAEPTEVVVVAPPVIQVVVVVVWQLLGEAEATPTVITLTAVTAVADTMRIRCTTAPLVMALQFCCAVDANETGAVGRWFQRLSAGGPPLRANPAEGSPGQVREMGSLVAESASAGQGIRIARSAAPVMPISSRATTALWRPRMAASKEAQSRPSNCDARPLVRSKMMSTIWLMKPPTAGAGADSWTSPDSTGAPPAWPAETYSEVVIVAFRCST